KMKQVTLLILTSALFCKVLSLTCYQCIPETSLKCAETQIDCPDGQCSNMKTTAYMGNITLVDMEMKNCSSAENCVTASVNFGDTKTRISNQCCDTNLCNSITKNIPNGIMCYTCNGEDCSSTLYCVDNEDHCIKSTGSMMMMRGCATGTFCKGDLAIQLVQSSTIVSLSCCKGNLCNGASRYTLNPLLLGILFSAIVVLPLH
uniref:UPAR/Ly6 domain-containing protein n=1 Tax=Electrophorus electricus TaxID=8005 RepID=A0A4W4GL56_ELEEL